MMNVDIFFNILISLSCVYMYSSKKYKNRIIVKPHDISTCIGGCFTFVHRLCVRVYIIIHDIHVMCTFMNVFSAWFELKNI